MLEITNRNIQSWFTNLPTETYQLDFENTSFPDILYRNKGENNINVVILIGNTIGNVQDELRTLKNIEYTLYDEDIFIFSNKLEKYNNLADFEHISTNHERHLLIPKMLGIDTKACEVILKFEEDIRSRVSYLKLDKDYKIKILDTNIILYKGEEIKLWRYKMTIKEDLIAKLNQANLEMINYSTDKKMSHFLMMCKGV
jgi:hypothetical protein